MKSLKSYLTLWFTGWHTLDFQPPNELLIIMDDKGNLGHGQPTYYPFEVKKLKGDEHKPWGWRGTVVHYEDGIERWDGGWLIFDALDTPVKGDVIKWKLSKIK